MPKVSIIIPVYNAAKPWKEKKTTLHRCVDSILAQDYKDFELILVDDGSTDDSGAILDEYTASDERICVIHKENTGVSNTRNRGISCAKGQYIQFADADDWLDPEAVKLLVRKIESSHTDMVIADFYRVVGEYTSAKGDIEEDSVLTRTEYAEYMMKNPADYYYGVLWNKLYKASIISQYSIQMDEDLSWCEDFVFNLEYVYHCRDIAVLRVPIYYYVKTEGSLVSQSVSISNTVRMKLNLIEYYDDFYREILPESEYLLRKPIIYGYLISAAGDGSAYPILPSTKKLGRERINATLRADAKENAYTRLYRQQKQMDRYLETASNAYDLDIRDIKILLYGATVEKEWDLREAADFAGLPVPLAARSVEKLIRRKFLHRKWDGMHAEVEFTEEAAPVISMIQQLLDDFEKANAQDPQQ